MNIRKIKEEDFDNGFIEIYEEGYIYHYNSRPDIFNNKSSKELKEIIKEDNKEKNILVIEEENIIGFVMYQIQEKHNKILWIDELVITKDKQHKGYGKLLMNKIKEIAQQEDCERIEFCCWSFNENAIKMYEHMGYEEQRKIYEMKVK